MGSIIRIKRSGVAGNPNTLAAGELAYSALPDNGSNGGDRLYIGFGTETAGNAAEHIVIGGKYFTDKLDHSPGTLTASSAIIVDANKKIDELLVDNLSLNGNTLSTTNTNGDLLLTPNGTGKTIITNPYIGDGSTSLAEFISDTVGGSITAGTGITVTTDDVANTATVSITNTGVVADTYGSSTSIPVITVNAQGQLTSVTTAAISTSFTLAADTGTPDTFNTGDTLTISGGEGIGTGVTNNTITISAEDATSSNKGIASFDSADFTVTSGAVSLADTVVKTVTTDSGALTPSGHSFSILGGEGIDVTHSGTSITVAGEDATTSNKGIASFNSASFAVTSGDVTIKTGGVSNAQLANSAVTIGSTSVALGATTTSLAGLTELTVDNLNFNGNTIAAQNTNGNVVLSPNGTGTVDVSGKRITGLATPEADTDAATKLYVDTVAAEGLHVQEGVDAATTDTLAILSSGTITYNNGTLGVGATLTTTGSFTTGNPFDGVVIAPNPTKDPDLGGRILVKNEANKAHNGIYYLINATTLERDPLFDSDAEIEGGDFVFVVGGTINAGTGWVQTNTVNIVGTDEVIWQQFSGAGTYTAGAGLELNGTVFSAKLATDGGLEFSGSNAIQLKAALAGNGLTYNAGVLTVGGTANRITVGTDSIDIASTYVGQTSITTLGTIGTGTWNATTIATTKGGTGLTSYAAGDLIYASATDTLSKLTKPASATSILEMTAAGVPSWTSKAATGITGVGTITTGTWNGTAISVTYGGTNITSYTTGDMLYASDTNTLSKLAAGADGQVMQINASGVPVWGDIDGGVY